jgi:hypothetical protein
VAEVGQELGGQLVASQVGHHFDEWHCATGPVFESDGQAFCQCRKLMYTMFTTGTYSTLR